MGQYLPGAGVSPPRPLGWCPEERQEALALLRQSFVRIDEAWQLTSDAHWVNWVQSDKCEENFHGDCYSRLTSFQRILIIQAVRPDRLETALNQFACEVLGVSSLSPPPLSFTKLLDDEFTNAANTKPVLFVTTPGADPSQELEEFAKQRLGLVNDQQNENFVFRQLAMGGGQNDEAIEILNTCAKHGDWVCLKNLHLVISWIPLLEKQLKNFSDVHPNFRCWLTTEPHFKFPPILLESSLKITYEAPPGLKKNLLRTFESWSPQWFETSGQDQGQSNAMVQQKQISSPLRSQVLFLCAHFHAILQERRTYIPQGWTKFYEFSSGDLASACETVSLLLLKDQSQQMDWQTLHGVLELAVYGSRVDNDFDLRLVREYLSVIFRADVLESMQQMGAGFSNNQGGQSQQGRLEIPPFAIPRTTNLLDYKLCIEKMPDIDNPMSFGMSGNVDRSLQRINSQQVISNLRHLKTSASEEVVGGGTGSSSSSSSGGYITNLNLWEEHISPLWKFWESTRLGAATARIRPVEKSDSPVNAFILLDVAESQRLGNCVGNDLQLMKRVVNGTGLSTPDIQAIATDLIKGQVPDSWTAAWPSAPDTPMIYLQQLAKRCLALKNDWLQRVHSGGNYLAEKPVKLADFLRPEVFLNALRQQTARKLRTAMDNLVLVSSFNGPNTMGDPNMLLPVQLEGLLLEGSAFDRHQGILLEAARQSNVLSTLPNLTVSWTPQENKNRDMGLLGGGGAMRPTEVEIPLYVSLNRERFLCSITGQTDNPRQRIFNSTAMFLTDI